MVRPAMRSTTHARIKVRTPGGNLVLHIRERKKGEPTCAICRKPLRGTASGPSSSVRNEPLSSKRPSRYFGGVLCHSCLSRLIKDQVRRAAF